MKNLLIGGTGFIGTALAKELVRRGETVTVISSDRGGEESGVTYVTATLGPDDCPDDLLKQAEKVFILIGQTGPNFDAETEKKTLQRLTKTLQTGQQKVFYFSSVHVYGESSKPATETSAIRPIGTYSTFKRDAETLLGEAIPAERLVIFRLTNVYGSSKNRGFIGLLMNRLAQADSTPITLNSNGRSKRDYILIDDVVGAVLTVANDKKSSGIVNVATGQSYSLLEVLERLEQVSGRLIPHVLSTVKPGEPELVFISNHQLQKVYHYHHFTTLEDGLKITLKRYQKEAS
ncbi:MAG TPA: NAD-dependent epimerase/dehydratase family protein [Candidatus Saccharimonadales bacterium]|nr:NAD-dependent epimerase/dehydratase family protein [Candidatus Saccharimonadales bacterium]